MPDKKDESTITAALGRIEAHQEYVRMEIKGVRTDVDKLKRMWDGGENPQNGYAHRFLVVEASHKANKRIIWYAIGGGFTVLATVVGALLTH